MFHSNYFHCFPLPHYGWVCFNKKSFTFVTQSHLRSISCLHSGSTLVSLSSILIFRYLIYFTFRYVNKLARWQLNSSNNIKGVDKGSGGEGSTSETDGTLSPNSSSQVRINFQFGIEDKECRFHRGPML